MAVPRLGAAILVGSLAAGGCGRSIHPWEYAPRPLADSLPVLEPAEIGTSLLYESIYGGVRGLGRAIDVSRRFDGIPPALNADPFDEVVSSTWFTNRNGARPLPPEEIFHGPQDGEGPDQSGEVTVTSIKRVGVSPGFNIEDAAGDTYILKFDSPDRQEMESGAEVITTNLVWSAGYHTPENYVLHLDPSRLVPHEELEIDVFEDGSRVTYRVNADDPALELTPDVLVRHLLAEYPRRSDDTVRAMASKFIEGIPKGPLPSEGMREDDPNDVIPHEHRRELRGLYVVAAWLNHVDTKEGNNFDSFIVDPRSPGDEDGPSIGYLRHHLIDFGSALGSRQDPRNGTEYDLDVGAILLRLITFGIYKRPWQRMDPAPKTPPGTGYYQVDNFDPADWRSNIVNPAFINRTPRDGYWGAKLVMSFSDAQLEAAVRAGRYSDPHAAAYLLRGLRERRDATGRYWFREVSPLDRPRVEGGAVVFDDLWIRHFGGAARYEYELDWDDGGVDEEGDVAAARIPLPPPAAGAPTGGDSADDHLRLEVRKVFDDGERTGRPATIWLRWTGSAYEVGGVRY